MPSIMSTHDRLYDGMEDDLIPKRHSNLEMFWGNAVVAARATRCTQGAQIFAKVCDLEQYL